MSTILHRTVILAVVMVPGALNVCNRPCAVVVVVVQTNCGRWGTYQLSYRFIHFSGCSKHCTPHANNPTNPLSVKDVGVNNGLFVVAYNS